MASLGKIIASKPSSGKPQDGCLSGYVYTQSKNVIMIWFPELSDYWSGCKRHNLLDIMQHIVDLK